MRPADTVARLGGDEFVVVCEDIDERTAIALGHRLTEAIHEPLDVDGDRAPAVGVDRDRAGRRGAARSGRAAGRRRRRRLPRQGRGPRARRGVRPAPARARARAAAHGRGAGAGAVARAAAARVPADRAAARPARRRPRGAAALGLAGRRDVGAGGLHPGRRGVGADRRDRRVDADAGLPRERGGVRASARTARSIGVNLSRRQLAQPDLPALVADCLRSSGLPARPAAARGQGGACCRARPRPRGGTSTTLRELGVGLALDDFGTGYSSLRDLPVRGGQDRPLVRGAARRQPGRHGDRGRDRLAGAARSGIDAIAEGVENEEQAARLRELGCPLAQGYLFGAPGAADNLRDVTTFEELDALSSRELHDRAVKRAERRLDVPFFWRLMQEGTAADAADGDVERGEEDSRALEPPGARRAAPRRRRARGPAADLHRLPAQTLGIARIRPSGGLVLAAG